MGKNWEGTIGVAQAGDQTVVYLIDRDNRRATVSTVQNQFRSDEAAPTGKDLSTILDMVEGQAMENDVTLGRDSVRFQPPVTRGELTRALPGLLQAFQEIA